MSSTEFAKAHLREHLIGLLVSPVADGFWSIYDSAKELCDRNGQLDQVLRTFQNMLTRIPEWSEETLNTEVDRIIKISKCTYLDDLLMGVFISYMKSFASLHYRGSSSELKIEFERPSISKFIHEMYKQSARKMWQMAYYFKTVGVPSEQQARNRQDIERVITECMEQVIRSFLPWEAIAKKYFADDEYATPTPVTTESVVPEPVSAPLPEPTPTKVVFEEPVKEEEEEDDEEDDDETDDGRGLLEIGEEEATIDFEDMDKPKEEVKKVEAEEEVDPLKEIEGKASEDTLVINL
jgi:Family of unknown function (DUF5764)